MTKRERRFVKWMTNRRRHVVYGLVHAGHTIYVGLTGNPPRRQAEHKEARPSCDFTVIEKCWSREEACHAERKWITHFREIEGFDLENVTDGGEDLEYLQKIRSGETQRTRPRPFVGRPIYKGKEGRKHYKLLLKRAAYFRANINDLEKKVQPFLESLHFENNQVISPWIVDFIHWESKVIVEVNGNYWHMKPELYKSDDVRTIGGKTVTAEQVWRRDESRNNSLRSMGYEIFVFWEDEICEAHKTGNLEHLFQPVVDATRRAKMKMVRIAEKRERKIRRKAVLKAATPSRDAGIKDSVFEKSGHERDDTTYQRVPNVVQF